MGNLKFGLVMILALGIVLLEFRFMVLSMAIDALFVGLLIWIYQSEFRKKE